MKTRVGLLVLMACAVSGTTAGGEGPGVFTNSIGMKMVCVERGSFQMGQEKDGDFDERPVHKTTISRSFHLSAFEVTNTQYEQFDPQHRALRGKLGFSKEDNEAVVFVSWEEATAFCRWLSEKEGRPYRLPTEAEWEYACRAGSTTLYHAGDTLPEAFHKNVKDRCWYPSTRDAGDVVPLHIGRTPPNAWGLYDMHGNVEEWCADWYGPYEAFDQMDPVGRADGDFRVTRGGSHSTALAYLRSANRSGTLSDDRSWLIGFRVACGEMPKTAPLPPPAPPLWAQDVRQDKADGSKGPDPSVPFFKGPIEFVKIPRGSDGPLFGHNHDPALVACPNGDLLAIWYTCRAETGRELGIAASRLRRDRDQWEPAAPFWDAPDRNDHAPAFFLDDDGTIYHFNGLSAGGTWGSIAMILRTSTDHGASWSRARLIQPEHGRQMPAESVFKTREGVLILPVDGVTGIHSMTIWTSKDGGRTWADPGADTPRGSQIAGIHAGVVQLKDGRLMALGRGRSKTVTKIPISLSGDGGRTWTYRESPFPAIAMGQRLVLTRLNEGPILLASFAGEDEFPDLSGKRPKDAGLFAAVSEDEGETWKMGRLISPEARGYLSVHQTPDNVIHLISSKQYYSFNLAWLRAHPVP